MRCPDCGYLLLDPKSHCPKCEKTLQEKRARAAQQATQDLVTSDNAPEAAPPQVAQATAAEQPAPATPKAPRKKKAPATRASEPLLPFMADARPAPPPLPLASIPENSTVAAKSEAPASLAIADQAPDPSPSPEPFRPTTPAPVSPEAGPPSLAQEAIAAMDALGEKADELALPHEPVLEPPSAFLEPSDPVLAKEAVASERPEPLPRAAAPTPVSLKPSAPPARSLENDLAELSISLSRKLQVPVGYRQTTADVEDATGSVFRDLDSPTPDEISEWSMTDIAGPAPKAVSRIQKAPAALPPPVLRPLLKVPAPPVFTPAAKFDSSLGARTGEIPPPKSYSGSGTAGAGEATLVSARIPQADDEVIDDDSSGRWNTTGWIEKTQPPAGRVLEKSDSLFVLPQPSDATQISFPAVPRDELVPPDDARGEQSADYPSAEILGEASTRLSARLRGGKATLRGKALGRRLIAFALDNVLTLALAIGFLLAGSLAAGLPLAVGNGEGGPGWGTFLAVVLVIRLVLDACYQIGYLAIEGRTPGKRLMGLRVLGEGVAERPTFTQAAQRWLWSYALTFGICWGYLWVRRDREGRALHDRKAHTRIIPA